MNDLEPLLSVSGIGKTYGAHRVLDRVSFELHSGEVLCIVGENGAGKSTLIKILSGAVEPDSGTITVRQRRYSTLHPKESMQMGIATIYQDVELIDSLSVADNIFLGNETMGRFPLVIDGASQRRKARQILDMLHIDIDEGLPVEELSAAQKQNLQIAKALHQDARVLIMDEPTSSLGLEETRSLMKLVQELKKRGIGIIYISHYLEEIFEIGDTILILKDGEQIGTYPRAEIDVDRVIRSMVGRDASMFFVRERVPIGESRVRISGISWGSAVRQVSFDVRSGEVLGIGGLVGSGRSELAACIFGMVKRDSGDVFIDGRKLRIRTPADAIRNGICLITEDRKKYAMFGPMSVRENIVVVHTEFGDSPFLSSKRETRLASEMVHELHISAAGIELPIASLSGGNQQKAIIGRWLLNDATLFILDEPTKGVDVGAKEEIYKLVVELARKGKSIIMISSDMPELLSMSDRIGVMREGRLMQVLDNRNVNEEDLIRYFIGL
ncbi:MAG: sugar ABC transporter ATP-binding protein [Rectinemataceae bacterium]